MPSSSTITKKAFANGDAARVGPERSQSTCSRKARAISRQGSSRSSCSVSAMSLVPSRSEAAITRIVIAATSISSERSNMASSTS